MRTRVQGILKEYIDTFVYKNRNSLKPKIKLQNSNIMDCTICCSNIKELLLILDCCEKELCFPCYRRLSDCPFCRTPFENWFTLNNQETNSTNEALYETLGNMHKIVEGISKNTLESCYNTLVTLTVIDEEFYNSAHVRYLPMCPLSDFETQCETKVAKFYFIVNYIRAWLEVLHNVNEDLFTRSRIFLLKNAPHILAQHIDIGVTHYGRQILAERLELSFV